VAERLNAPVLKTGRRREAPRGFESLPLRSFGAALGPPLAAFLLVRVALFIAARDAGYPYFHYLSWHRFDSGFYVDSATHGYTFLRCVSPLHGWCGRAGWFPGYSILIAALSALGPTPRQAAITVSLVFCAGALVVLWIGLLDRRPTPGNLLALTFAAFVPGQIYDHTVFPLSVASFFVLLAFALLRRRRYTGAGLAGAAACMSYPTAVLIAPLTAAWVIYAERGSPWLLRLARSAQTGGLMALGLGAVLVIDKLEVGVWTAYFKVQAHYDHTLRDPFSAWFDVVKPLRHGIDGLSSVPALEAAFVAALIVGLLANAVWRPRSMSPLELLALAFAVAVWLFPLSFQTVDIYRSDALLIPVALLVRRLPLPAAVAATAAAIALSVPMAEAFFVRILG
jgi:hypothetical protein